MLRAYKVIMYVAIDPEEDSEEVEAPVTDATVKRFLQDALMLDCNLEDNANSVGFRSAEIIYDTLTLMTEAEAAEAYGKSAGDPNNTI